MDLTIKNKCCICGKEFNEFPSNANPIKDGCCCGECNSKFVYHARLLALKCHEPLNFEVVKNGQNFLDLSKKLYERDFEFISKNQNGDIKFFKNVVTNESVVVFII